MTLLLSLFHISISSHLYIWEEGYFFVCLFVLRVTKNVYLTFGMFYLRIILYFIIVTLFLII